MYYSAVLSRRAYTALDERRSRFSKGVGLAIRQAAPIATGFRLTLTMTEGEELIDWLREQGTPWSHEAAQALHAALQTRPADRIVS
jgi:hypothetical protein